MPRPRKRRSIQVDPNVTYFKPRAVPMNELEQVTLKLEEVEALRLKDLDGLNQEESAKQMNVSIATFQRILYAAHKKVAEALVQGKAIAIEIS